MTSVKLSLMNMSLFFNVYYRYLLSGDREELMENYSEMLDVIAESGYKTVDVLFTEVDLLTPAVVKQEMAARGLEIGAMMYAADLSETDQTKRAAVVEKGCEAVRTAADLGIKIFMLIPKVPRDTDLSEVSAGKIHDALVQNLAPICRCAAEWGICPVIEDTPDLRLHLCKAADLKAVLDRIPEMMLVYDSGNTLLVREDPAWYARQFAGRIGHVHLKDMKPAGPGDRGADVDLYGNRMACAPIGTGTVDFDAVLTALEDGGYHGLFTVEFIVGPDKDYPKSLRSSRLYAEQLLAKARDAASRHGG